MDQGILPKIRSTFRNYSDLPRFMVLDSAEDKNSAHVFFLAARLVLTRWWKTPWLVWLIV